ncbi:hypothetical protein GCM10011344_27440 [Dokdonia pacifica]|nr:hypothetical protein GCM10011344_27440 [Dokdonia pacifica]
MQVCLLLFLATFNPLHAQNDPGGENAFSPEYLDYHANSIPPTPNAASFTIYGDTPVNTATGIPQINIPLFNLVDDGVSIPISLSYHASGVKVDDLASVVGLKWTLSAGGGIFREVKDKQDEVGWLDPNLRGYIDPDWVAQNPLSEVNTQNTIAISDDTHDYYPDDFNYNFPGGNGNFIFNTDGSILEEYQTRALIETTTGVGNTFNFKISDDTGNTFFFGENDKREYNSKNILSGGPANISHSFEGNLTGWMLDRIVTKNNKQINFSYQQYLVDYSINGAAHNIVRARLCPLGTDPTCGCQGSGSGFETTTSITNISYSAVNKLISQIESDNVLVTFNYQEDTSLADWQMKLNSIDIKDKITNKTKSFNFTYSSFSGNARLRLDEVQEIGFDGSTKPPYKFTYESGNLPEIGNKGKDIYGYYNGQSNSTLIPYAQEIINILGSSYESSLADRSLNESYLKRGVLKNIKYPTGGSTEFILEPNAVPVIATVDGTSSVSVSPVSFDSQNTDGIYTVFRRFFMIEGSSLNYSSYSDICDTSDPNSVNFECSSFNIYPAAGDGVVLINAEPFWDPDRYIGPSGGVPNLESGWYFVELRVKTSNLVDPVTGNTIYPVPNIGINVTFPVTYEDEVLAYRGGLRVKEILNKDTDGNTLTQSKYSYEGLHGFTFGGNIKGYNNGERTVFSSDNVSLNPLLIRYGHYYDKVTTERIGDNETLKSIEYFQEKFMKNSRDAQLIRSEYYKPSDTPSEEDLLVRTVDVTYENITQNTVQFYTLGDRDFCFNSNAPTGNGAGAFLGYGNPNSATYFFNKKNVIAQNKEINYFYDDQNNLSTSIQIVNSTYNDNLQIQSQEVEGRYYATNLTDIETNNLNFDADGEHALINYTYVNDHLGEDPIMNTLMNKHCLGAIVSRTVTNNNTLTKGQFFDFDNNGNVIATYRYNKGLGSNSGSAGHIPSNYDLFTTYDVHVGKAVEIQRENSSKTVFLWDISKNYLLAQIQNAPSFLEVSGAVGGVNLSAEGLTAIQENAIRSLPNTLVTTFTYDPLLGLTSQTDPNGYTTYYEYDDLNRLKLVKDQDGNIYSKNEYHYNINN